MSFPELYDLYLQAIYNRPKLFRSFDRLFSPFRKSNILDCAAGTGFLSLDLIKAGYAIELSDSSKEMLTRLEENASRQGLPVVPRVHHWSSLGSIFPERFDLLICRGNSLMYADTWEDGQQAVVTNEKLKSILQSFAACIKPHGSFYLDLPNEKSQTHPIMNSDFSAQVGGLEVRIEETIIARFEDATRIWRIKLQIGESSYFVERASRLITFSELQQQMIEVGFGELRLVNVEGEREHFSCYLVEKKG